MESIESIMSTLSTDTMIWIEAIIKQIHDFTYFREETFLSKVYVCHQLIIYSYSNAAKVKI